MIVAVFGSSKTPESAREYKEAAELGKMLAQAGYTVCNGGYGGIMEASARGAKEAGGKTLGITTAQFPGRPNRWIQKEKQLPTWRERLFGLIETADAYVVFGGGTGTLVELFTVWEMTNKKMLAKPIFVYGASMRFLIDQLKTDPAVIFNSHLRAVSTLAEITEGLKVSAKSLK